MSEEGVRRFFAYARRRHEVFIRKSRGDPPPWTADPILQQYRFTNIFREDDRTTIWCREHIREAFPGSPLVLPALVIFRWFNKIETGAAMMRDDLMFRWIMRNASMGHVRDAILRERGSGPYVNGAYIIKSPNGMTKLDGVLYCCQRFLDEKREGHSWYAAADAMASGEWNLEDSWNWLREYDQQGDFTAYEVITDLRHTHLLRGASDIMTWANAGPGAKRGLNRVFGRPLTQQLPKIETCAEMRHLLDRSRSNLLWPRKWGQWEMREVEHTLCEYDKWERTRLGEGTPKQRYSGMGDDA